MGELPSIVLLSTADYDAEVWTNKQHMASRLAAVTDVYYIDSMGLRRPGLNSSDLTRMARRVHQSPRTLAPRPPRLKVLTPRVIPLHGSSLIRGVNKWLIDSRLRPALPSQFLLWTYSPLTYGLERAALGTVYHSVDLLHTLPRIPADAFLNAERQLLTRADAVIASAQGVREHLLAQGRPDVLLWENVADTKVFSDALPGPHIRRALFAGNLTPTKIDIGLLIAVAEAGLPLDVAGPLGIDGSGTDQIGALLSHPNVSYHGVCSQAELASLAANARVGLIPYRVSDHTEGIFPMKVYEYAAAGLKIVSTPLPSLLTNNVVTVTTPERFAETALQSANDFSIEDARTQSALARPHSWEHRLAQVQELIGEVARG